MPLPFILGGLAVAAVAGGASMAHDGHKDKTLADDILRKAKRIYEIAQKELKEAQAETMQRLEGLGESYLRVGQDFHEFGTLASSLIDQVEKNSGRHLDISLPKISQAKIENIAIGATSMLGSMTAGGVAGGMAAYAVYGGVMAFAAASTGTPIAALSGVAAYNATLAAIGGGSIASGGFGMAVGAKILGGVVAAPVALFAGAAYAVHGEEALKKAKQSLKEAELFKENVELATLNLSSTRLCIGSIERAIRIIHQQFQGYLDDLKIVEMMVRRGKQSELAGQSDILRMIENGYALAAILADIITTPLFKIKTDKQGNPVLNDHNEPVLEQNELGLNIVNDDIFDVVDVALDKSQKIE